MIYDIHEDLVKQILFKGWIPIFLRKITSLVFEKFENIIVGKFDALIALAFEHHLAIAKNIPLENLIDWFLSIAPKGLIEFVPKEDDTIKAYLRILKTGLSDKKIKSPA